MAKTAKRVSLKEIGKEIANGIGAVGEFVPDSYEIAFSMEGEFWGVTALGSDKDNGFVRYELDEAVDDPYCKIPSIEKAERVCNAFRASKGLPEIRILSLDADGAEIVEG